MTRTRTPSRRGTGRAGGGAGGVRFAVRPLPRQPHRERRAVLITGARRRDAAVVRFDEVTDDRQPEPEAAMPALGADVLLAERLEDVRQELPRDAAALVGDRELQVRLGLQQAGP